MGFDAKVVINIKLFLIYYVYICGDFMQCQLFHGIPRLDFRDKDGNDTMQFEIAQNYIQIKLDVKQIVAEELKRISKDENLKHLINKE